MQTTYTYTDSENKIIFSIQASDGKEADRLFEQALGYKPLSKPFVTCLASFDK